MLFGWFEIRPPDLNVCFTPIVISYRVGRGCAGVIRVHAGSTVTVYLGLNVIKTFVVVP